MEIARRTGTDKSNIFKRRVAIEQRYGIQLRSPNGPSLGGKIHNFPAQHKQRIDIRIKDGVALVGSDEHIWPGPPSLMHRAFLWACREFEPKAVIKNGDVIDASTISRHPPINWESRPTVQQEIETAQERQHEVEMAAPRDCEKIWNLGNHDSRYETRLATVAPEFAKVHGMHLKDHFPHWRPAWSTWINNDVVVKHRFKGGIHAPHNNTMWSGKTMITGHLHSAKVIPFDDYNGTRYGVDTGCMADTDSPAFVYTEDNPKNWRSAFCVLTFIDGVLLQPELVLGFGPDSIQFRGKIINVSEPKAPRSPKVPHAKAARAKAKGARRGGRTGRVAARSHGRRK